MSLFNVDWIILNDRKQTTWWGRYIGRRRSVMAMVVDDRGVVRMAHARHLGSWRRKWSPDGTLLR